MRIAVSVALLILGIGAACGGSGGSRAHAPRHTTGAIAGLARDHDSGDPVAKAELRLRAQGELHPRQTTSNDHGLYDFDHLSPGTYQLSALFAGQPVEIVNIDVRAGETTYVDVVFTLGRPDPVRVDYGDPQQSKIDRYRPKELGPELALIEGTVSDLATRERVAGAVVTMVLVGHDDAQQTVSDEQGRFKFPPVTPGTYSVSAYYSIGDRGQVEVRRSDITVDGAEAVIVPLWVETVR